MNDHSLAFSCRTVYNGQTRPDHYGFCSKTFTPKEKHEKLNSSLIFRCFRSFISALKDNYAQRQKMTVVLAFDSDEAGDKATDNAILMALGVEDDRKDFLRSYVMDGRPYNESISYLSNASLAEEFRFSKILQSSTDELLRAIGIDQAEECQRLIQQRSIKETTRRDHDTIRTFNKENTITSVMSSFGHPATPGRSVRCPMHDDSTPSFSISRDDGRGYCFNQSCVLWHDGYGVDPYELNKIMSQ